MDIYTYTIELQTDSGLLPAKLEFIIEIAELPLFAQIRNGDRMHSFYNPLTIEIEAED